MLVDDRVIVVNQMLTWQPRIEFTLYHELVHYLLNEDGELIEFFTATLRDDDAKYRLAIERCCHQGAAEFVLPQSRVRDIIAAEGFAAHLVERIATRSATSLITAAIQLTICAPVNCYVVLCGFGPIPRSRPPTSGLHIEYAPTPWRGKYPLARFTRVPDDHLLAQVWKEHEPATGTSYVPFRSGKRMPCHCDATYVAGRVIGILALERRIPRGQLALI